MFMAMFNDLPTQVIWIVMKRNRDPFTHSKGTGKKEIQQTRILVMYRETWQTGPPKVLAARLWGKPELPFLIT